MKKELICIICPMGCNLTAKIVNNEVTDVIGNTCPRGKIYAQNELTNPTRTITTTIRCSDGSLLPVKTSSPIPKDKIMETMNIINSHTAHLPLSIGDVIIDNVFGSKIVAAKNMK